MIVIQNRRTPLEKIQKQFGDFPVLDVTSRGKEPWIRFSPFYPHGGIPVPFSPGWVSTSVEGIWQGLKVFEQADVDRSKFRITTMKGIKRSVRMHGKVRGHRRGVDGNQLLSYKEARYAIYLPSYYWTLEHYLQDLVAELKELTGRGNVILLDYEVNCDVDNVSRPLSHAGLIKLYIEDNWPSIPIDSYA
ncbi:MAG TPA: hypothetical protein VFV38_44785 [Ktedonobacteraceae bacterium]|nr:hypothetical protein [Ktedonobacteraceae bacterium]